MSTITDKNLFGFDEIEKEANTAFNSCQVLQGVKEECASMAFLRNLCADLSDRLSTACSDKKFKVCEVVKGKYRIELFTSEGADHKVLEEISEFFCFTFNNDFPECFLCPTDKIKMSAAEALKRPKGSYITIGEIYDLSLRPPCCSVCKQPMKIFHSPSRTFNNIHDKVKNYPSFVALLRDDRGGLVGMTFASVISARKAFEKEWHYEFTYLENRDDSQKRDITEFEAFISQHPRLTQKQGGKLTLDSEILLWNCIAIHPEKRRKGFMPLLYARCLEMMATELTAEQQENMFILCETMEGSEFDLVMRLVDPAVSGPGLLGGGLILVGGSFSDALSLMRKLKKLK